MDMQILLTSSWDQAAAIYHQELAPRFLPWTHSALSLATSHLLPTSMTCKSSPIFVLVPCCGTMLEANLIVGLFRTTLGLNAPLYITGIDLSPQMVNIANQVSLPDDSGASEVRAVVGDAAELSQSHQGSADLIFSSFGLQQLGSRAPHALSDWCLCLNEGGLLLIVLWPSRAEEEGPWKAYQDAVNDLNRLPSSHQSQEEEWEHNLLSEALKLDRIKVLSDEILQHEISWSGVDECWRVMTRGGPWTARRVKYGNEHMDDLKLRWEKCLKNGLVLQSSIKHYPRARIIAIRKEYNGAFPVRQKL